MIQAHGSSAMQEGCGGPPIFVVGFQRSGTTLLQALLGAHSAIGAPPEIYFIFRVYHLRDYFGDLRDDDRLRRAVHETLNPLVPVLADAGFDEDRVFERVKRSDRSYRALFDETMRDFAQRQGKRRWSDKTPGQMARDAWEIFPEAQVVHIVRDPREVVASSTTMPWERADAASLARRYLRFTLDNVTAGSQRGPAQYLRIRYEDLCRDPEATLRLVCAFLNERYEPEMLTDLSRRKSSVAAVAPWQRQALDAVAPAKEGAWRDRLRALDRARVAAIVAPLVAPYGYAHSTSRARLAGAVLNLAATPAQRMASFRAAIPSRSSSRSPDALYALVRRYQEEQSRRVRPIEEPQTLPGR